jgi:hypothetical protein
MTDIHYEWELEDAQGDWQAGGSANDLEAVRREGYRYLRQFSGDGFHRLIIRQHQHQTKIIEDLTFG